MGDKYLVERQSCQAVNSRSVRLLRFGALSWRQNCPWKDKIDWFTQSPELRALDGVDGEPVVFALKKFPHHTEVTSGSPKYDGGKYCSP